MTPEFILLESVRNGSPVPHALFHETCDETISSFLLSCGCSVAEIDAVLAALDPLLFGEKESFYTLKGLAETVADALNVSFTYEAAERTFLHPYQTAEIFCEGERVGYLGKLSYEIQDELDMRVPAYVMEIDLAALKKWYGKEQIFTPLPKFAEEKRDFAFVVDKNITCAQIENGIREACKYVTDVNLFDVYEGIQLGPDKKSMAFSVVFTPQEEELTGEMVEGFVKKILKHLEATLDIRLRA